jgi:hypothetical protein
MVGGTGMVVGQGDIGVVVGQGNIGVVVGQERQSEEGENIHHPYIGSRHLVGACR